MCPLQPQNRDWKVGLLEGARKGSLMESSWEAWLPHVWSFPQPLQCLKVLTMSGWNPPPGNRKMHGDLMYLFVITAEDRQVSITASTRGFYLNQ